jgi:hypothetical protein
MKAHDQPADHGDGGGADADVDGGEPAVARDGGRGDEGGLRLRRGRGAGA